jgi:hypothetical protein
MNDIFSKTYFEFREKYKKVKDSYLYVQFTDYKQDMLDRTTFSNPNHSDPVGNYAYPLSYVINYPTDIWYGYNSKNIRILELNKYAKVLNLSNMDTYQFSYLVTKFGYKQYDTDYYLKNYKDRIYPKNSGYYGRLLFQMIQVDLEGNLRSGEEQTKMLLKAGFDVIKDESKSNKTAVINNREPEQICFLNRKSFKVVEVFSTYNDKNKTQTSFDEKTIKSKFASRIFEEVFNDKIKEKLGDSFYSVKGREIHLNFTFGEEYMNSRKIGEKIHKEFKKSNQYYLYVFIYTEKGEIEYQSKTDETFDSIIDKIQKEWNKIKNNDNIDYWIRRSIEQKKIFDKKKSDEYTKKTIEKENEKIISMKNDIINRVNFWKNKVNFDINIDETNYISFYRVFEKVSNLSKYNDKDYILDLSNNIDDGMLDIFSRVYTNKDKDKILLYIKFIEKIVKYTYDDKNNLYYIFMYSNDYI